MAVFQGRKGHDDLVFMIRSRNSTNCKMTSANGWMHVCASTGNAVLLAIAPWSWITVSPTPLIIYTAITEVASGITDRASRGHYTHEQSR